MVLCRSTLLHRSYFRRSEISPATSAEVILYRQPDCERQEMLSLGPLQLQTLVQIEEVNGPRIDVNAKLLQHTKTLANVTRSHWNHLDVVLEQVTEIVMPQSCDNIIARQINSSVKQERDLASKHLNAAKVDDGKVGAFGVFPEKALISVLLVLSNLLQTDVSGWSVATTSLTGKRAASIEVTSHRTAACHPPREMQGAHCKLLPNQG